MSNQTAEDKKEAKHFVQNWINEKGYVTSFNGEITVPPGENIKAGEIVAMMEAHTQQRLTTVKEKAEQIKEKCLGLSFDERDDMEGVISEIDVKLCFNEILTLIEDELQ